jgi:hypothetical protein
VTIREQCAAQRGAEPCIRTYGKDGVTVTGTYDCVGWCPVLHKLLDVDEPQRQEAAE